MTRFYDMITTVDLAFAYYPYLLLLIFLFAFICFTVKIISDVSRKKRPKRRYIAVTAVCGVICCGMGYGIHKDPPELRHGYGPIDTEQMVSLVGYDYNQCKQIYASYFDMEVDKEIYSSEYPAGVVIEHSPKEGSIIAVGNTTVRCTVSKGPQMISVPNTYELNWETAEKMIGSVGLTYAFTTEYSETVPEGCVISTNPERNEMIEKGSTVKIVVSKGKEETSAENGESEVLITEEE